MTFTDINDYVLANRDARHAWLTHRLICRDGFSISFQASDMHYSSPRQLKADKYTAFELGYPSADPGEEVSTYAEEKEDLLGTVYGYVPLDVVQALLDSHGGIKGCLKDEMPKDPAQPGSTAA